MKDKLIKLLEEVAEVEVKESVFGTDMEVNYSEIADHLIANGVTVQQWIPVEERLPTWDDFPNETSCYILSDRWDSERGFVPSVSYAKWTGRYFTFGGTFGIPVMYVTHWMPTPKPPKEV